MGDKDQGIKYDGDVLTDITSFSMVQNIFDGQKKINRSQIETLDSIIQLLVFYDSVWIVEPFIYGGDIEIKSQEILNTLIQKKVIKQFPQIGSDSQAGFISQFEEIQKIISPQTLDEYKKTHSTIASDLQTYEENFGLTKNEKAKKLADLVHLDHSLIPLTANLLRANFYFKLVQMMEVKNNKIITYSPNVLRTSLVDDVKKYQDKKISNNIHLILKEQLDNITAPQKERMKYLAKKTYSDIELKLPLLTALAIDQCKNKADFFDQILELRKDPDAKRIREWLKEFQNDISNNKDENVERKIRQLEKFSKSLGAESSNKAKLINCIRDPALIAATVASVVSESPIPVVAWAGVKFGKEFGIPLIDPFLNKDLCLLFNWRKRATTVSFKKETFEKLFNVKIHL